MLYPLNLNIKDKLCAVIGGSNLATRKTKSLLAAQAKVKVISPEIDDELKSLPGVEVIERKYQKSDLEDVYLAIAATDNQAVNKLISKDAKNERVLVNVVDSPELCDFYVPSVIRRGDFLISVSTSGKFPSLSKRLRKKLEKEFGKEYEQYLDILGQARGKVIADNADLDIRKQKIENLAKLPLIDLLRKGKVDKAKEEISLCI